MSFGGSSGTQHSTVEQTTTSLPEYAEPYYRDLLTRTGAETATPYQAYQGDRLAYFSPMEQEAMTRYGQLGISGTPEELNEAGRVAAGIAGAPIDVDIYGGSGSNYRAGTPNVNYASTSRESGYDPSSRESEYLASQMTPENQYQYGQREVGYVPGSLADNEMLARYADPYYQQVVDIEKREATRQAEIRRTQTGLEAAGMGSLGGYREAIEQSENERNLMQQTGDIQARGSQQAFADAKASFEADRSAQAQLEQFGQSQFGMNEQARQRAAELMQQGWSMNEAARQAQEEFRMTQFGMNEQAQQASEQFQQSQFGLNSQNSQFQAQLEAEMYKASEQAKQQAAALGLQADQIKQAGDIAAQNAMIMLQQNQLQGAGMLGDFALQRQGMEVERLGLMQQAGLQERGLMQQGLDIGYQDYLRQQAYPKEQLAFYSQMLQGTPVQPGSTTATYGQQPTTLQSMLGSGIAGAGLYNAYGGGG